MDKAIFPFSICSRCVQGVSRQEARRLMSTTARRQAELQTTDNNTATPDLDPFTVSTKAEERLLQASGRNPIGPRRRRALLKQIGSSSISFDQMPYQCFQEARKVLQEDRKEKLAEIEVRRARIARLRAADTPPQDEHMRETRLASMRKALEDLKIKADINDPMVLKKFEDGQGTMDKPIYRFLADRKWREYKRKILMQRIEQMSVVPDVLPTVDPVISTDIFFKIHKIQHGDIVDSGITEQAPRLKIQAYDQGARLITIAVINPDVPNVTTDSFDSRCHFLACNIPLSPTITHIDLQKLDVDTQVLQSWLPPYSQRGLNYQRLAVCIFEQPANDGKTTETRSQSLDVQAIKKRRKDTQRHGLTARGLLARHRLHPVGIDLFRTKYDENTAGVMERAGITGADVEFKRKRTEPLPYKRLSGGRYR